MNRYYKLVICILFILIVTSVRSTVICQSVASNSKLQYGISFDVRWEIVHKYGYLSNFKIGVGAGVAPIISDWFMPFTQLSMTVFQGGIGSSISVVERNNLNVESILSFGLLAGTAQNSDSTHRRGVYTFGYYNPTPLTNPFKNYLGINSNFVHRFTKFSKPTVLNKRTFTQKIGSLTLGGRNWDLNYYNDGTPFDFLGLGDGKDRYYTGGGFFRYNIKNKYDKEGSKGEVRNFFVGFDRFTGHYPESFEVAHNLGISNVPYGDKSQAFFNKGRTFFGLELAQLPGLSPTFSLNDNDVFDIQYLIHRLRKQPIHRTLHKESFGFNLYYKRNYWDLKNNLTK
jgi:hypothetical protein